MIHHDSLTSLAMMPTAKKSPQLQTKVTRALRITIRHVLIAIAFLATLISGSYAWQAVPSPSNSITLVWTAPGDDGTIGQASEYDIRYSTVPITDQSFSLETAVGQPPRPQSAGQSEQFTVRNLQPGTKYFFALKSADERGNTSTMSNVVSGTTAAGALPIPTPSAGAAVGAAGVAIAIILILVFRKH